MSQKIAFIGLGKMGTAMVEKILEAGLAVTVYNRTVEKTKPLVKLGACAAESLAAAVLDADIVFTSVIDDDALISVTDAMLPTLKKDAIHVSTSTILPSTTKKLEQQHLQADCYYIAAPVLGVPTAVRAKKCMTICSGEQTSITNIMPILAAYSGTIKNLGNIATHASILKICLNYSLISTLELISELYVFAEKSGLDPAIVQEALHDIYAHPAIKAYIDKIHARNFTDVNFALAGGNKDVNLFQQAFAEVGVIPDIANIVRGKFTQALAQGMENQDWSAISEIVRQRSGLK